MKTTYKIILLGWSLFISCSDDFLEVTPQGVHIPTTVSDFQALMVQRLSQSGTINILLASDDFNLLSDRIERSQVPHTQAMYRSYFWEDQLYYVVDNTTHDLDWVYMYSEVYIANYVLSEIDNAALDGASENDRNNVKGQALTRRAYAFFTLANLYGKHYTPGGASSDLAVPLFTDVPDPVALEGKLERATVAEVYAQVESDIDRAIELLPDYPAQFPLKNYRPSKMSAYALKARIHLYKGEWEAALEAAETSFELIEANADVGLIHVEDHEGNWGLWSRRPFYHSEILWRKDISVALTSDFEAGEGGLSLGDAGILSPGFRLSDPLIALVDLENDTRLGITTRSPHPEDPDSFLTNVSGIYATALQEGFELPKDASPEHIYPNYLLETLIGTGEAIDSELGHHGSGGGRHVPALFTVADVLLMLAETHARLENISQAEYYLETLRVDRILNYEHQPSPDPQSLLVEIINERRIEMMLTGLRWFDIKRLNAEGWNISIQHPLKRLNGTEELYELHPGDNRFVLQLPHRIIIEYQPGLEQND